MKKDSRLALRIASELKKELEGVAAEEGRSVAQVCEAFLKAGLENYQKQGSKQLARFFSRRSPEPTNG